MLRELGIFERAVLISNRHAPFHINGIVKLNNPPSYEEIVSAIKILQTRHPLLCARIKQVDNQYWFVDDGDHNFPFQILERSGDTHWVEIAEQEMAHGFQIPQDALFRITYLKAENLAELIFAFHHAIADAASLSNIIDEFLRIIANENHPTTKLTLIPKVEERVPKNFKGSKKIKNLFLYGLKQIFYESFVQLNNIGKRKPPVRLGGSGKIITLFLSVDFINTLAHEGRKQKLTLNTLLNAAQLIALNRHLYQGAPTWMYTFSFANLRPYTDPPTPDENLGSYISMMRIPVNVNGDSKLWELSKVLQKKYGNSFKAGDKFSTYFSSEFLLKMITKFKFMRFGTGALNYNSELNIKSHYGKSEVLAIRGFVSGYDLGPELGSQARIFRDQLVWDFTYLNTDFNSEKAQQITEEIKSILEQAITQLRVS